MKGRLDGKPFFLYYITTMNVIINKKDGSLTKGSVVKYKDTHMEVTAVFKNHVNLGGIFHGKTTIKKVPLSEVTPDHDNWFNLWTQSESYQCM